MPKMPLNGAEADLLSDMLAKYINAFGKQMSPLMLHHLTDVMLDCKLVAKIMEAEKLSVDVDGRVIETDR